jgi:hypothetical protein
MWGLDINEILIIFSFLWFIKTLPVAQNTWRRMVGYLVYSDSEVEGSGRGLISGSGSALDCWVQCFLWGPFRVYIYKTITSGLKNSVQKISAREPQGARRQDELIGCKSPVVKVSLISTLVLARTSSNLLRFNKRNAYTERPTLFRNTYMSRRE